ncbi:hypothetical protein COO60DRAFT_357808 [Scenedesmus sp. NREL 46B-D3]|nr:hypothetical protein COO60DRAFT_357808 [Scenedesmus sp. NREL 46B-D3]
MAAQLNSARAGLGKLCKSRRRCSSNQTPLMQLVPIHRCTTAAATVHVAAACCGMTQACQCPLPQQQLLHEDGLTEGGSDIQVSALQHPFIVPCVESWTVQSHTVNMIYGYCKKGDLSTHLQRVQRMVSNSQCTEVCCSCTAAAPATACC